MPGRLRIRNRGSGFPQGPHTADRRAADDQRLSGQLMRPKHIAGCRRFSAAAPLHAGCRRSRRGADGLLRAADGARRRRLFASSGAHLPAPGGHAARLFRRAAGSIPLVGLYGDLQVYKHIAKDLREEKLLAWWELHRREYPELRWNEFAAATGSTLGMFTLFAAALDPALTPERAAEVRRAYFPHVCGLHILLDYLIDQEEDREGGDLNFCNYYSGTAEAAQRIGEIVQRAREDIRRLPEPGFHRMIVEGLLALYLSDPKVSGQQDVRSVSRKLMRRSPLTRLFFFMNSVVIRRIRA
ncbi:hypothetical protein BN871_GJ_00100 [Paenibacillus sp. P22]|nr:hypothetical protein BN871_GJ_00100 [Paenibacillus sp. P22]